MTDSTVATPTPIDTDQLPYLLRLLADETPQVREAVTAALLAFGPDLDAQLESLPCPPTESQWELLREVLGIDPFAFDPSDTGTAECFTPGQVVCHKRYGYRGVVVATNNRFQGSESWYQRNQTQPDREQPWYHVLVDGSGQVTYSAHSSLIADCTGDKIAHPYLPFFFSEYADGRYVRNNQPWPG